MPANDPFLLQLLVIFLWAKIFGELFEQLHMPAVLGEILAGIILGPYATAIILPSGAVNSVAQLGAIFLLFTVGLGILPREIIKVGQESLVVAAGGISLTFLLGFCYMLLRHAAAHEAIFVAAAMVATSVGITARVLGDMNVLHARAAQIILGAAVFDDIFGMLVLAIVVGLLSAGGMQWLQFGLLFAEAIGFVIFMIFLAPRVIQRMRPGLSRMSSPDAPLILALAICLLLSVAAERIGMAAIIGAFFAGLAFAEYSPEWNLLPRVKAINEFLSPYFFFIMGSRLNIAVFSKDLALVAIAISLLAIISKLIGCGLPLLRYGWRISTQVGVGMVPRGEVGLIVALVGLQMNMITQSSYAILVCMTGATIIVSIPLVRWSFRAEARPRLTDLAEDMT